MNNVCMDASTHQVLLGSILGDGCITKNTKKCNNYCFKKMHGPEQREYVACKGEMLKQLGTIVCGKTRPEMSKDKMLPVWEEMFKEFNIPSSMKYKMTGEQPWR